MKKKKHSKIISLIFIVLFLIIHFSLRYSKKWVFVHTPDLESKPGIKILDANNPFFNIIRKPNHIYDDYAEWKQTKIILKELKYRTKKPKWKYIYINSKINNNESPLIIDTGFRGSISVNDMIVKDNNLEIYPLTKKNLSFEGFCHIDKIHIGDITIENPKSQYSPSHYERKILGITTQKQRKIIMGLEIMRAFKYILIDNIEDELEFSMESFNSDPNHGWNQYNMYIDDSRSIPNLMINIPIAGENTEIAFDTGYDCCLIMTDKIWEQYSTKLNKVKEKICKAQLPFGFTDIRKITIDKLNICDMTFSNETIDVFSNDNRFGPDFFMFGIDCFKKTVIVLDFEHNLFWVKKVTD